MRAPVTFLTCLPGLIPLLLLASGWLLAGAATASPTRVSLEGARWHIGGQVTYPGTAAEGLLMNVRMVNATFDDTNPATRPAGFDADANTAAFIARLPEYVTQGVRAITLYLQGGMPGYEGATNSAIRPDGSLDPVRLARIERVIRACAEQRVVAILGMFYQRQSRTLDAPAIRAAVVATTKWIQDAGFDHVVLEIANEYGHSGYRHPLLRTPEGQVELIRLARATAPGLLVSTSGLGHGRVHPDVAAASDFILVHYNTTRLADLPARIAAARDYGKPVVCNEDDKVGPDGAAALRACVDGGVSWGLMAKAVNQSHPFSFRGAADDPEVYAALKELTSRPAPAPAAPAATGPSPDRPATYFPPPESQGGWRTLTNRNDLEQVAGVDPDRLTALRDWLLASDQRNFAAVVIRRGYVVLRVERGNSAATDSRRVASVSKAVCATVLAIASERSRHEQAPVPMRFEDPAFRFIPQAQPLSDPRKAAITVKQLLNHTSGITPESTGVRNTGPWEFILGHTGDPRTAKLAFDPGTASGYSTHALYHAAMVCETVTGQPYDQFAIEALFKPLGIERWWFERISGAERYGTRASHSLGLPALALARIAYCMLHGGRWGREQVIPAWFVAETAAPTHDVRTRELRFGTPADVYSHGWELLARLGGNEGAGIPPDARSKNGSGGQFMGFVPSLDLVIARQTGGSGAWEYAAFLRRASAVVR
jgi:CubicO group peptidase (beta-lactamase class C family)